MKKISKLSAMTMALVLALFASGLPAMASDVEFYSKAGFGFTDGDAQARVFNYDFDKNNGLKSDNGTQGYLVPFAARVPVMKMSTGSLGLRLEPYFTVGKDEATFEYAGEEKTVSANVERDTWGFGGRGAVDYKIDRLGAIYGFGSLGVLHSEVSAEVTGGRGMGPALLNSNPGFDYQTSIGAGLEAFVPGVNQLSVGGEWERFFPDRYTNSFASYNVNPQDVYRVFAAWHW